MTDMTARDLPELLKHARLYGDEPIGPQMERTDYVNGWNACHAAFTAALAAMDAKAVAWRIEYKDGMRAFLPEEPAPSMFDAMGATITPLFTHPAPVAVGVDEAERAELERLRALVNAPQLHDFAQAVVLEAAHQRERWGAEHDAGKEPSDWFWLLGYLSGKALRSHIEGDTDKALHHTISSAAALANWHAAVNGVHTGMRPGIDTAALEADR